MINNKIKKFLLENIDIDALMQEIEFDTLWDEGMKSRKTASYGKPYNYNNTFYKEQPFSKTLNYLAQEINDKLGYLPNNCLINYYFNKESSMGYHSDNIEILEEGTGITILSLGNDRVMKFKNSNTKEHFEVQLIPGEFLHMTSDLQKEWKHSVPPAPKNNLGKRISLTFRKLKSQI